MGSFSYMKTKNTNKIADRQPKSVKIGLLPKSGKF